MFEVNLRGSSDAYIGNLFWRISPVPYYVSAVYDSPHLCLYLRFKRKDKAYPITHRPLSSANRDTEFHKIKRHNHQYAFKYV